MATKYQMQGLFLDGSLVSWLAPSPDFAAAFSGFGTGELADICLTGGGLDNTAALNIFHVTAGGIAVTAGGAEVDATPITNLVTAGGVQVTAGGVPVAA